MPSWAQVARKTVPKNVVKKQQVGVGHFNDFYWILASNRGGRGGVKNRVVRYFFDAGRLHGAKMAPRWLREQFFDPFSPP